MCSHYVSSMTALLCMNPLVCLQFVCCMAFDGGTLYVGLDDGTIKIYSYNDDPTKKNRFVVRPAVRLDHLHFCLVS